MNTLKNILTPVVSYAQAFAARQFSGKVVAVVGLVGVILGALLF